MKFKLLLSLFVILMASCGGEIGENAETVEAEAQVSSVFKGSSSGKTVPNPIDPNSLLLLEGDYFSFVLKLTNNNEKSIVITHLEVEVTDHNLSLIHI